MVNKEVTIKLTAVEAARVQWALGFAERFGYTLQRQNDPLFKTLFEVSIKLGEAHNYEGAWLSWAKFCRARFDAGFKFGLSCYWAWSACAEKLTAGLREVFADEARKAVA